MSVAALWEELVGEEDDPLSEYLPGPFGFSSPAGGLPLIPTQLPAARYIVEAAFGADLTAAPQTWNWYDITVDVLIDTAAIVTTQGRSDESSQAQPATCTFQLDNTLGAYSPYQPAAGWWPNVKRNTPIRVRVTPDGSMAALSVRFQGYANGFTPSWNMMSREPTVTVSASGILRRLQQGNTPLRSALYRANVASNPTNYWPLEELTGAAQASSGVGGIPMTVSGKVQFGSTTVSIPGSAGAVDLRTNGATLSVALPSGVQAGFHHGGLVASRYSPSSWQLEFVGGYATTGSTNASAVSIDGSLTGGSPSDLQFVIAAPALRDGLFHHVAFQVKQNGADVSIDVFYDGVFDHNQVLSGFTLGIPTAVKLNPQYAGNDDMPIIAHVALFSTFSDPLNRAKAAGGYTGETATARLARLGAEQGIPIDITGASDAPMGPQGVETALTLFRECEATDGGLLADGFGAGLLYVTRSSRYNAPVSMLLDATADEVGYPFVPVDDDQRTRNLFKVSRKNGSSATFEDISDSLLGTAKIGTYDSQVTVNSVDDSGLVNRAAWEVRRGTVPGLRYPQLVVDLVAVPQHAADWLLTSLGERVDVANVSALAPAHPSGTVSQVVEGWTEIIDNFAWSATTTCSPFEPQRVAVLEGSIPEYRWRLDSGASTLHQDYPAGSTSLLVDVTDGYPWSTDPGDYPRDLDIGGIQVTATVAPTGTTQQTFTVAATAYPLPGGSAVKLWRAPKLAL